MATTLRDAIWGDIELGPRELAVIDSAPFQRLRRIRQLGFTDLVFPGARHTRFEHSLGVYHLAGLALDRIALTPGAPPVGDLDRRTFRCAALLHDVGHYPFSHAIEELEVEQIERHERIADTIIRGSLSDLIASAWDVDPVRVAQLVAGPGPQDAPASETDVFLRTLLDSSMDVDKLDYLVRDARGANVPYGLVDVQRLIGALCVWRDDDGRPVLAVGEKGLSSLVSLVFAKHLMFATVYWHHACRSAVAMLLRAVQEALRSDAMRPSDLEQLDDATLMLALGGGDMPELTQQLASRLHLRRLYKRAGEIAVQDPAFKALEQLWFRPMQRAVLEDGWAAASGAPAGSVLLDVPEPKPLTSGLPVVLVDGEPKGWDEVSGLHEDDLARLQRWVRRIRVFAADPELASAVSASLDDWFREAAPAGAT
jgi:uncharacterized protein